MAIDSFANLKAEVSAYLNRSDISDAQIENFVSLAEASFDRVIRVRDQIKRSTASISTQYIALPSDLLELYTIQLNTSPVIGLEQVTLAYADQVKPTLPSTGKPRYYTISGEQIEFLPTPDATYTIEIVYYSQILKLNSDTQTTSWLLSKNPDLYLFATLSQAEPFLMNDERIGVWNSFLEKGLEELRLADEKAQTNTGTIMMRPAKPLDDGDWF